ncbi:MAG: hypothetical protein ACKPKO_59910, partial [Candidatus Fonsibacter sp.]
MQVTYPLFHLVPYTYNAGGFIHVSIIVKFAELVGASHTGIFTGQRYFQLIAHRVPLSVLTDVPALLQLSSSLGSPIDLGTPEPRQRPAR